MYVQRPSLTDGRRPGLWRAIAYIAATLPFLLLLLLALVRPDLSLQQPPDWKPVFARAEASREKGDLYEAGHLYSKTGRLAAWQEDWVGLLAAACGMKKLNKRAESNSNIGAILIRAMLAAESRQSRVGMSAVATAFTAIGEHNAASMVLSRVQTGWPEDNEQVEEHTLTDCWRTDAADGLRVPDAGR